MLTNEKEISCESSRIITVNDLLSAHDIDENQWKVVEQKVNTWETAGKNNKGELVPMSLYQVKATLVPSQPKLDFERIRQEFKQDLADISPVVLRNTSFDRTERKDLLELCLFDHHMGQLTWEEETGADYNLQIASIIYWDAIQNLTENVDFSKIGKILVPVGNDFFNTDYSHPIPTTTNKTPQQDDSRWHKIFREGRKLLVEAITYLSTKAPVDVVVIPGNHDEERSFYLGDSLEGWFHNNENVNINNEPTLRKYYAYGNFLILLTHGKYEKHQELPLIAAAEAPELWGNARFREAHIGHFHHEKSLKSNVTVKVDRSFTEVEHKGLTVRYMSSLAATDAWHNRMGYVGTRRSAEAFIITPDNGIKTRLYYNKIT